MTVYYPGTSGFILTFFMNPLLPLRNLASFKEKAFGNMWLICGPLLAGLPKMVDPLLASSKGLILDVGPGSGEQVHHFTHPENITAVYAVEPGVSMHAKLLAAAKKANLDGKYHVLGCTADMDSMLPHLIRVGLVHPDRTEPKDLQIFDEIVCLRVLCGVPEQESTIADLYSLLKPGGRFVVCEHVANSQDATAIMAQRIYMFFGWQKLMGGCDLMRHTLKALLKVAKEKDGQGFKTVEVKELDKFSPAPHLVGVLTKGKGLRTARM